MIVLIHTPFFRNFAKNQNTPQKIAIIAPSKATRKGMGLDHLSIFVVRLKYGGPEPNASMRLM